MKRTALLIATLLPAVLASSGCGKEMLITQYPEGWQDGMDEWTVRVRPFEHRGHGRDVGEAFAAELADQLRRNGTYRRVLLESIWTDEDYEDKYGHRPGDDSTAVDAVISGQVMTYQSHREVFYRDANGHIVDNPIVYGRRRGYQQKYLYTPVVRYTVDVSATARLARSAGGRALLTVPGSPQEKLTSEGNPPEYSRSELLAEARREVVQQMLPSLAVTRQTVRVRGGENVFTATGPRADWKKADKLPAGLDTAYVVVKLPRSCARNTFTVRIWPRESDQAAAAARPLFEQRFTWREDWSAGGQGWSFDPSDLSAGGGAADGKYVLRFYNGNEPVVDYKFEVLAAEAEAEPPADRGKGQGELEHAD